MRLNQQRTANDNTASLRSISADKVGTAVSSFLGLVSMV